MALYGSFAPRVQETVIFFCEHMIDLIHMKCCLNINSGDKVTCLFLHDQRLLLGVFRGTLGVLGGKKSRDLAFYTKICAPNSCLFLNLPCRPLPTGGLLVLIQQSI